jgi:NAD(P)-dependent dehydrogenase (short-subunit alcohol dehydrogenase family)
MRWKGLGSVVTGAGSGLGRGFAEELGHRGARVVVSDVSIESARETVALLEKNGVEARAFACDVRSYGDVASLRERAEEWLGEVDLIVNNAGVAVAGPIGEVPIEDWRWVVDVNLFGVIHGCEAFVPAMKKRGRGAVVNVASAAGLISAPDLAPYCATKAAVVALSECLHAEVGKLGVHVTVLCPTFFRTNILDAARGVMNEELRGMAEKLMDRSPLDARGVAAAALDSVEKNALYAVPMRDGRTMWRMKRMMPNRFAKLAGNLHGSSWLRRFTRG